MIFAMFSTVFPGPGLDRCAGAGAHSGLCRAERYGCGPVGRVSGADRSRWSPQLGHHLMSTPDFHKPQAGVELGGYHNKVSHFDYWGSTP